MKWLLPSLLVIASCSYFNSNRNPSSLKEDEWVTVSEGDILLTHSGDGNASKFYGYQFMSTRNLDEAYIQSSERIVATGDIHKISCSLGKKLSDTEIVIDDYLPCSLAGDEARIHLKYQRKLDKVPASYIYSGIKRITENNDLAKKHQEYELAQNHQNDAYYILNEYSYYSRSDREAVKKLYKATTEEVKFSVKERERKLSLPVGEEIYVRIDSFNTEHIQKNFLGIKKKRFKKFQDENASQFGVVCRSGDKIIYDGSISLVTNYTLSRPAQCVFNLPKKVSKRLEATASFKMEVIKKSDIQEVRKLTEKEFTDKVSQVREEIFNKTLIAAKENFDKSVNKFNTTSIKNLAADAKFYESFPKTMEIKGPSWIKLAVLPEIATVKISESKFRHYLDLNFVAFLNIKDSANGKIYEEQLGDYFTLRSKDNIGDTDKALTPEQITTIKQASSMFIRTSYDGVQKLLNMRNEQVEDPRLLISVDDLIKEIEEKTFEQEYHLNLYIASHGFCDEEIAVEGGYQMQLGQAFTRYSFNGDENRLHGLVFKKDEFGIQYIPLKEKVLRGNIYNQRQFSADEYDCFRQNKLEISEKI